MDRIVTLAERKEIRRRGVRRSAQRIKERLAGYARETGGRFIIFGSAASGDMNENSDIDILADFPDAEWIKALLFAERLCAEEKVPCDIFPYRQCDDAFVQSAERNGVILS